MAIIKDLAYGLSNLSNFLEECGSELRSSKNAWRKLTIGLPVSGWLSTWKRRLTLSDYHAAARR